MKQNQNRTKLMVLALLFLLFILPGCLALWFFQHPQWLSRKTINKGQLISPLMKLDSLNQKKWHLLLISNQTCEDECLTLLDKLARVRLALGRLSREVDLRLMVVNAALLPNEAVQSQMKDMAMESQVLSATDQQSLLVRHFVSGLFIVDPQNYMVLSYPFNTQQKSIYKDLKQLISLNLQSKQ